VVSRTPLPAETLAPGQAATLRISMDGAALSRPNAVLRLGLVHKNGVWLESAGFPMLRLKAGGPDTPGEAAAPKPPDRPRSPPPVRTAVTRADVIACYRNFLGREPESEAAIEDHMARSGDLWTLIRHVLDSPESARWRWHDAASRLESERLAQGRIEVEVSDEEARRLVQQVEDNWREQGERQPFFSALANPDYLTERLTEARREGFYATGDYEVALLGDACRLHGVDLSELGPVLEFGCRVGRVAEPLARACGAYTGVDISPTQLDIAADRLRTRGLEDARFLAIADGLAEERPYGLLFSVLVFQHFPPPVACRWLDGALDRVRVGGFAYFQLPCMLYDYSFVAKDHLLGRGRQGPLALHALPQSHVFSLLNRRGFAPIEVVPSPRIGAAGVSCSFFAQRLAAAGPPGAPGRDAASAGRRVAINRAAPS
jgi:SAM-dependent methyltransferase